MTDFMKTNESALILEAAMDDIRPTCFRAILFEQDEDTGAMSVLEILESSSLDVLRDMLKKFNVTHYRKPNAHGSSINQKSSNAWSDALHTLKMKLHADVVEAGGDISKNATPLNMCNMIQKCERATTERAHAAEAAAEEKATRVANAESRAAERADFDAWQKLVRDNLEHTDADYMLCVAMRNAYVAVEAYPALLAEHVEKLTADPFYTLGWMGDFVEATAAHMVAKWAVELFEAGVSAQAMQDEAMRSMFDKPDRATSRSSSVMSNLNEDCLRVAWSGMAKRLSGRSFW